MPLRYALAVVFYCAFIFWESSKRIPIDVNERLPGIDKLVHAGLYGVLAALVALGMRASGRAYAPARLLLWPIAFSVLYGISDELHQAFVPGREFDPWDALANFAGAALAMYYLFARRWKMTL